MTASSSDSVKLDVSTTLREILTPGVMGVPAGATMDKALSRMSAARISSVLALSRGRPVGILTERGVIAAIAEHGQGLLGRKVREVMSSPVLTAPDTMHVHRAFSMLLERGYRHLVVTDAKGKAMGMVTQTNVVQHLGVEYFVEIKRVGQIMSRGIASLPSGASLARALEVMAAGPLSCVVVLEGRSPAGILTERDMVAEVAAGRDLACVTVEQAMSKPVVTVAEDTPVHQAAALMSDRGIRRLVVADGDGRAVGLLTQSDLVKGMEARYVEMLKEVIREKDELLREAVSEAAKKSVYLDTILNTSIDTAIAATEGESIAFVNQAARDILGEPRGPVIGMDLVEFHKLHGVSPRRMRRALAAVRRDGQHCFSAVLEKDGKRRFMDGKVSGIRGGGGTEGYVLMLRDVTERHEAEETIRRMAYFDALTGLPNRFLVMDRLTQGLSQAKRRGCLLAVMLMDLDGFKLVNDTLGHNVGDMLLKAVAESVRDVPRKSDTVGRMGGDEFLVVLPEVKTPEGASAVASKMLSAVRRIRAVAGHPIALSASIGLAMYPWDGSDALTLIKKADAAMYAAKDAGRDTYMFSGEDRRFNYP